jgi:peptide/nickel transport system substrate-binding protein
MASSGAIDDELIRAERASQDPDNPRSGSSRREFVKATGTVVLAVGASGLLEACGGGGSTGSTTATNATNTPLKQGGRLRVGLSAGSPGDSIDAALSQGPSDAARLYALYNQLSTTRGSQQKLATTLELAEEMTPNSDGSVWTIRLRSGVEFHNGKTLDIDDFIFTMNRLANPKLGSPGFSRAVLLDLKNAKKLDKLTIRVPLVTRIGILPDFFGGGSVLGIVPVGYDPKHPVGTGPFKLKSFTPGQQAVFERFPNYWDEKAKIDELVLIDLPDDSARYNALVSGQIDVLDSVPSAQINTLKTNSSFHVSSVPSAQYFPIYMRVDAAPFNDVRVRQAMRLCVDRKQIVASAYDGNATVGNDVFDAFDPLADSSLVRPHDPEQARSLLRQAGRQGLTVTLVASQIGEGTLETCQILAQNAKAAGINIRLRQVDAGTLFGANYGQWPFANDSWPGLEYLLSVTSSTGPHAHNNITHFTNSRYNALYAQAIAALSEAKRAEIAHEMQRLDFDQGGEIIPVFPNYTAAYSTKVGGFYPSNLSGVTVAAGYFNKLGFAA